MFHSFLKKGINMIMDNCDNKLVSCVLRIRKKSGKNIKDLKEPKATKN